jgi:hypothetical protein
MNTTVIREVVNEAGQPDKELVHTVDVHTVNENFDVVTMSQNFVLRLSVLEERKRELFEKVKEYVEETKTHTSEMELELEKLDSLINKFSSVTQDAETIEQPKDVVEQPVEQSTEETSQDQPVESISEQYASGTIENDDKTYTVDPSFTVTGDLTPMTDKLETEVAPKIETEVAPKIETEAIPNVLTTDNLTAEMPVQEVVLEVDTAIPSSQTVESVVTGEARRE